MAETIPQANPGAGYLAHRVEVEAAMRRVLEGGRFILGAEVGAFEREFAAYLGVAHAVGVANGTDALDLALRVSGVGPGCAVATVAHTAVATVAAIRRCGAVPLFVDVDPRTYTMDSMSLERTLAGFAGRTLPSGEKVAALIPVHLYGCPADMPPLLAVARRHGLAVIEDCAQAHGAALAGTKVGRWGDLAAFSFYPTKNLGAMGDGGMVVTGSEALAARLREAREYGWRHTRFISESEGVNSRLDELQAALLRVRLPFLDRENDARIGIAARYDVALASTGVQRPWRPAGARHVFHQYVIQLPDRERALARLAANGVGCAVHYPVPVHRQPAYARFAPPAGLPVTEALCPRIFSLPMFPQLDDAQVDRVAVAVRQTVGRG